MDSVGRELDAWLAQMPPVDAEVEAARQRIGRLSRLFVRLVETAAEEESVTLGHLESLSVIRRNGGATTPGRIGEELGLTSGSVSSRLRRLEEAGLVEPAPADPEDGRVRRVRLTARGLRVWQACTARRTAEEARLFARLDPAALSRLNETLGELLAAFEDELGPVSRHDRS